MHVTRALDVMLQIAAQHSKREGQEYSFRFPRKTHYETHPLHLHPCYHRFAACRQLRAGDQWSTHARRGASANSRSRARPHPASIQNGLSGFSAIREPAPNRQCDWLRHANGRIVRISDAARSCCVVRRGCRAFHSPLDRPSVVCRPAHHAVPRRFRLPKNATACMRASIRLLTKGR